MKLSISLLREKFHSPAFQSAFWVLLNSGGYQLIRLGGNLILTRLLFPEAFGVMALVFAVMVGLGQISDVGLREGVVNNDRITDPSFMRTAWTLQIIRSGVIALIALAIAYPFALYFEQPILAPVLIWIALGTFITGFKSIALLAYDKRLDLKLQMLQDLGIQVLGLTVTLVWAKVSPSVWAPVAGYCVACVLEVIASYIFYKGHFSRFALDRSAISSLFKYGKWIVISSTISWVTTQGDRLFIGSIMEISEVGIYSQAATWAAIVALFSVNVSTRVLHPYFRQSFDHHSDFSRIHRIRNTIDFAYVGICVFVAIAGQLIIKIAYDDRYLEAGWMLQLLALGQVGRALTTTLTPFILARGDSFSQMKFSAVSATILVVSIMSGGWMAGTTGVILGICFAGLVSHPVLVYLASRHGFHCAKYDLPLILFAALACTLLWFATGAPVIDVIQNVELRLPFSGAPS
jgi:O-antigen/teichoic acid export membrane protein